METSGWISMTLSVGLVTCMFIICLYKVLTHKQSTDHMHGMNIESDDLEESEENN